MEHPVDVRHRSTECIRSIYELIRQCLDADRKTDTGRKVFGIQEHPGWRDLVNSIEHELALRDELIEMIEWDDSVFFGEKSNYAKQ